MFKKCLKLYLLFCLVCFAFVLYKSDYFDETLIILLLFLFVYSISKYIYNKIYEKNVKKIVDVSNNIKNLSELNKKYNFLKIKNKSRVFREREYSVKKLWACISERYINVSYWKQYRLY